MLYLCHFILLFSHKLSMYNKFVESYKIYLRSHTYHDLWFIDSVKILSLKKYKNKLLKKENNVLYVSYINFLIFFLSWQYKFKIKYYKLSISFNPSVVMRNKNKRWRVLYGEDLRHWIVEYNYLLDLNILFMKYIL